MLVLVRANIFVVGLGGRSNALKALPVRVSFIQSGLNAARSLKNECVDSVISKWSLPDSPDGRFLMNLRLAKPYIPVIVVVDPDDAAQEIAARSIGAAAVLSSDVGDDVFRRTVVEVLGIDDTDEIQKLCAIVDDSENG
jgi:DNA-binding NarL/FixJ family response regulator